MLTNEMVKSLEEFVYAKPRSIQEIAKHIDKNWRTADRYVDQIEKEYGTVSTRTFRGGTRGALKIVYWSSIEKVSRSIFQEELEKELMLRRRKEEFSPFNIFQYVDAAKKQAWLSKSADEVSIGKLKELSKMLLTATKQVIFFSGNLSFINYKDATTNIFKTLEELIKKGVSIKVICRVDLAAQANIEKMLSLNRKYGRELIEIRHREQPLRATIIDKNVLNMKEVILPTGRKGEFDSTTFVFYNISDKEWIEWLTKIFFKMFSVSIDSNRRLEELKYLKFS
ncbi:MAG: hypothetical protein Q7R96_06565 [Nanoarchaeota archaeon]|nr:hypothetical protein [Nanoarchaeota archaeon]